MPHPCTEVEAYLALNNAIIRDKIFLINKENIMIANLNPNQFAFDSFVNAFAPGNEHLLDQYFSADLLLTNHSVSKQFNLNDLKSRLPNIHQKYQNLQSEIKDVIVENDRMAFHVTQKAFFMPDNTHVTIDVMNLYKLSNDKVIEWQIWSTQSKY
jgi:hypothetical protein